MEEEREGKGREKGGGESREGERGGEGNIKYGLFSASCRIVDCRF